MAFSFSLADVSYGPWEISFGATTSALVVVGMTDQGADISMPDAIVRHMGHEAGDVPIKFVKMPQQVHISIKALEIKAGIIEVAFPERSDSAAATTVTVPNSALFTELTPQIIKFHPANGSGITDDWVFYNMVCLGAPLNQAMSRANRAMIDLKFERQYPGMTNNAFTFGVAAANPA